ncbi:acetyl-coenzyme A synthetase N-terminal domain-containing protein, partial [Paracoccus siganidrum]|uniref:acetyl-coenzyme A synthetase N-terminal domain-containing protein n=1 Tax=Paracoccus siganidrum TaxID=1276757 RepID=UPI003B84B213
MRCARLRGGSSMSVEIIEKRGVPSGFGEAHVDAGGYARLYAESISDPEGFWGREGLRLDWIEPYGKVKNT